MEPGGLQNNEFCLEDLHGFVADSGSARHSQKIVDDSTIVDDIVTIGQSMGSEVEADDIEELLEDHCIELTTEVLEHLQNEPEKKLADIIEEKEEEKLCSQRLKNIIFPLLFLQLCTHKIYR